MSMVSVLVSPAKILICYRNTQHTMLKQQKTQNSAAEFFLMSGHCFWRHKNLCGVTVYCKFWVVSKAKSVQYNFLVLLAKKKQWLLAGGQFEIKI